MKRCLDHNLALKRIGEKGLLLGNTRFTDFIFIFRAIELILPLNFSLPQCLIESHSHYCKKTGVDMQTDGYMVKISEQKYIYFNQDQGKSCLL